MAALSPVDGTPTPPAYFGEHEVYAWVTALRSLLPARHVSHGDLLALEALCVKFGRWRVAETKCRQGGDLATTPNGHVQLSAERILADRQLREFMAIAGEFGLTPVARVRTTESVQGDLFAAAPAKAADADPYAARVRH